MDDDESGDAEGGGAGAGPGSPSSLRAAGVALPTRLRLRRAPRYRAFTLTGVVVGVLVGVVLTFAFHPGPDAAYSLRSVLGYLVATLGLTGALLGAATAVVVERRKRKR